MAGFIFSRSKSNNNRRKRRRDASAADTSPPKSHQTRLPTTPLLSTEPRRSFTKNDQIQEVGYHPVIPHFPVGRPMLHKFHKFMELPPELRDRIFEEALFTDWVICPHFCDNKHDGHIKFHDDSQPCDHTAINDLLGVTRVSKQVREESLPCFYSVNTFTVGHDTAIYFFRLEQLGRFHMIRHVRFEIKMRKEKYAVETLSQMNKHIQDMEAYERTVSVKEKTGAYKDIHAMLKKHPAYIGGGLQFLAEFSCLRMLTSGLTVNKFSEGAGQGYTSRIVIPIPAKRMFDDYPTLRWFPAVCHGLGIHVHYVEGHPLSYNKRGHIGITWHQTFQKTDFTARGGDKLDVKRRALKLYPDLKEEIERREQHGGSVLYYRRDCRGEGITWFKVMH